MHRAGEKKISCKRCQTRKIKCSRTTPCRSCSNAGVKCEFRADDWKRIPVSPEYITALEGRVAALESLLSDIKTSYGHEREKIIDSIDLVDHFPSGGPYEARELDAVDDVVDSSLGGCWSYPERGPAIFHGPGSAYSTGLLGLLKLIEPSNAQSHSSPKVSSIPKIVVDECISLFFTWQHPYCTIVDKNTLLEVSRSHVKASENCSLALLYAVCALGAIMSHDENIKHLGDVFSKSAEEQMQSQPMWVPHINSMQAMLLHAAFEAGRGNVSKSWMYSGMASRMAQDLGIHAESLSFSRGHSGALLDDFESQRRMSLTVTNSVKMLGFFFGRPSEMADDDSNSTLSSISLLADNLERSSEQGPYQLGQHNDVSISTESNQKIARALDVDYAPVSTLLISKQTELVSIIQQIQSQVHLPRTKSLQRPHHWIAALHSKWNSRLWSWHDSLPGDMRWSRWSSNHEAVDPGLAALHMMYHTARISLNRPLIQNNWIRDPSSYLSKVISDAINICDASVDTIAGIFRRFGVQYTLKNAPFVFVHGAIAAIDVTLQMASSFSPNEQSRPIVKNTVLPEIDGALAELSHAWPIAADARNGLRNKLYQIQARRQATDDGSTSSPYSSAGFSPEMYDRGITEAGQPIFYGQCYLPQTDLVTACHVNHDLQLEPDLLDPSTFDFDTPDILHVGAGYAGTVISQKQF